MCALPLCACLLPLQHNNYLLATCYRHCNQGYRAVHLLQGSNSQHCRYLAALCCLDLRQYKEAEQLLLQQGEEQVQLCLQLCMDSLQWQLWVWDCGLQLGHAAAAEVQRRALPAPSKDVRQYKHTMCCSSCCSVERPGMQRAYMRDVDVIVRAARPLPQTAPSATTATHRRLESCCAALHAQVPAGGAGWYLLGRISRLTGSSTRAAECYVRALRLEPMLWVAFAELCMLGEWLRSSAAYMYHLLCIVLYYAALYAACRIRLSC
jgi:tetratricopeptide (TPR) repeat protein